MAENRRGLGRGLSALLGESEAAGAPAAGEGPREIPIELIHRNPEQPRTLFAEAELAELADSIREKGVLQPILVRSSRLQPGEYQIVAGERRWRAAQAAGLVSVPALVREMGDSQAFEIAIVENVQRADLNPLEEAKAYAALMGRMQYTQDETAKVVGKSRSHVANTLRLAILPPSVQAHLMAGRLTAGHARAIATAADPEALAEVIVARGLSVREAEALAKGKADRPKKASGPRRPKDADTHALEADLEEVLGMSVEINDRGGAGELKVRYATLEQLDDLCRRLTRAL
ncbi:MAG TPA: ParB/RepB/Spo0J family partition protein [Phenylobacterium sp.]|uniref:ParB/RepB/Spo0J family partition protein n=1 Tax=Phenylobacterium sp. TaxID=1871053 RepID=UPI002B723DF8|nr:ParB/RepB/Spo0J family partition protein [Phenylobacterium sp.]HSV04580.1 ParB/RepB/Spo0J family partition protein [Phenylobacterium sp.]